MAALTRRSPQAGGVGEGLAEVRSGNVPGIVMVIEVLW
jgi:hypothetical protein